MKSAYLQIPDWVTTFRDYFKLSADVDRVAAMLGYSFAPDRLVLPKTADTVAWSIPLGQQMNLVLSKIRLNRETARRELMVAPVLLKIAAHYDVQLRIEYPLRVNRTLGGELDYFIWAEQHLLVMETQNEDVARGFSQLVAQLATLDQWAEPELPTLYGAVTIGTVWQFAVLHRAEKRIEQDLTLYRVPNELPDLCAIILGILKAKPSARQPAFASQPVQ